MRTIPRISRDARLFEFRLSKKSGIMAAAMSLVLHHPLRAARLIALLSMMGSALAGLHAQDAPRQHLEITGSERLRIIYDSSFVWPAGGGYSAVMDLPIPPETGAQHIESFTSSLKGRIETDAGGHRILTATLHHASGDERHVHWRVEITGIFQTRQLVDGPPGPTAKPIVPPEPGEFLTSTESINWKDDAFQDWLDSSGLRRKANEAPVAFGERVYAYLQNHGDYSYPPSSAWNSAACCRRLSTDCGGFSLTFAAACRANRIPARLLVGQCFKARRQADGTVVMTEGRQAHVIAEFFDPEIGWIPEDISSTFLRTPGYSDLNFFGRDPGYFFAWHTDTDFHFDTPRKADAHVQWIQNPNLWFSEDADDANDTVSHHWDVEKL
jgi:transglutaminase-like putative cysteine protease